MRKTIVFVVLIALACFLLCGCTPKGSENSKTDSDVKLPTLDTAHDKLPDDATVPETDLPEHSAPQIETAEPSDVGASGEPAPQIETEAHAAVETQEPGSKETDPITVDHGSEEPTEEPVYVSEYDPEMETASDYVVDGGDGFGIGGN